MSARPDDRRQTYDLDYFVNGGLEKRKGRWQRRQNEDNRSVMNRRACGCTSCDCLDRKSLPDILSDCD